MPMTTIYSEALGILVALGLPVTMNVSLAFQQTEHDIADLHSTMMQRFKSQAEPTM
jgi:hypothetical protein